MPIVLILLIFGATFFTIIFKFPNISKFPLAINTVRGKYDELDHHGVEKTDLNVVDGDLPSTIKDESKEGEVSHFQALATAVSGTVGLGNIAGVAVAIALGGPGATFWMIVCGLIGMSTKFVECTLGVKYRDVGEDGTVYGGPMYYLSKGLKERGFKGLGKVLAVIFAILCVGASFGGGNAFQSNQAGGSTFHHVKFGRWSNRSHHRHYFGHFSGYSDYWWYQENSQCYRKNSSVHGGCLRVSLPNHNFFQHSIYR